MSVHEAASDAAMAANRLALLLDALLGDLRTAGGAGRFGGRVATAEARIRHDFGGSIDIVTRRIPIGPDGSLEGLIAFADGMVDNQMIDQDALAQLLGPGQAWPPDPTPESVYAHVRDVLLHVGHVTESDQWDPLMSYLASGSTLLFLEGAPTALILDTTQPKTRNIPIAMTEPSLKGPQEAFNENILTHLNQIRRRIPTPALRFETVHIGSYSNTVVVVAHIDGVTNPAFVSATKERVKAIQRDYVQLINEIGPYLPDRRRSLFPLFRTTDRVDWVVRDLLNGKVAVMTNHDPFVVTLPSTFMDFFQTTQDYVFSSFEATMTRFIRMIGSILGLYLMPLYIALFSVNPDLVPTKLVLTVAGSREGIPFPPIMEVVIMWIIIEVLREAANRLPQQLATTIGTVGAVVVGTAIVKAGIVDPIMIVSVTLSALGLFTNPTLEMTSAFRWVFWILVGGAYGLGILGILLVTVGIAAYAASLETMGVPYLSPFAPLQTSDLPDTWVRMPIPAIAHRPTYNRAIDARKAAGPVKYPPIRQVDTIQAQVRQQKAMQP